MPGGPPVAGLPSDQLHQEARMAARYDQGDAASSLDAEEAEGEAHGWLIARSASPLRLVAVRVYIGLYWETAGFIQCLVHFEFNLGCVLAGGFASCNVGSSVPGVQLATYDMFAWLPSSGRTAHAICPSICAVCQNSSHLSCRFCMCQHIPTC